MNLKGPSFTFFLGLSIVAFVFPFVIPAYAARDRVDQEALNQRIALLQTTEVASPADLRSRYRTDRERLLPILPPDPSTKLNPSRGFVVFDPANFSWATSLEPAEINGVTVYPIIVAEDSETRYTIFYNGSAEPIGFLAPEIGYTPFTWLAALHPEYYEANADQAVRAWAEAVYDPARVCMTFYLLPVEDVEAMATAQVGGVARMNTMLNLQPLYGEEPTEIPSNLVIFAIQRDTNGLSLGIGWPTEFTNKIEVFARFAIATTGWSVVSGQLPTEGSNYLWWTDATISSNIVKRFFRAGNADLDSDGDGLTDARERMTWGTDENLADSDGDGLSDYHEAIELRTDPKNSDTNKPTVIITMPSNNDQAIITP
jgi:hypothetical protein